MSELIVTVGSPKTGSSIQPLIELLYSPELTSQKLTDFALTHSGKSAILSGIGLPVDIMEDTGIVDLMLGSSTFMTVVFANKHLGAAFHTDSTVLSKVLANGAIKSIFQNSASYVDYAETLVEPPSGWGGVESLLDLLYSPDLTSSSLNSFVSTNIGKSIVFAAVGLPKDILGNSVIVDKMLNAASFMEVAMANRHLGFSFTTEKTTFTSLLAHPTSGPSFWDSITRHEYVAMVGTKVAFGNKGFMLLLANDLDTLRFYMDITEERWNIFTFGGKDAADVLMRENAAARAFLLANYSTTIQATGTQNTTAGLYYIFEQNSNVTVNYALTFVGNFIGDYNTGKIQTGYLTKDKVVINERVRSLIAHHDENNSSWKLYVALVKMGDY